MPTRLHEIIPRYTQMPVELITDSLCIQSNHVFIIPANRDLHVLHGEFRLKPISKPRGWPDVITMFLCSLVQHWEGTIVAVIVSGLDGDGASRTEQNQGRRWHYDRTGTRDGGKPRYA
jgi:two-component system chemotaxis response regulator CheB